MLTIFSKASTSFLNNGLGVLKDFKTNPQIIEELNGSFYLEFEYAKDGWLSEYLIEENIIKANNQPFRICTTIKTLRNIKVLAKHLCFDLNKNFLKDTYPQDLPGNEALNHILSHTQYEHNFTGYSDILISKTARYVRKNVFEALISADNSMINVWGGEFSYDNFEISLLSHRGEDRDLTVRYGKNLTGIECNVDFTTVATRIMPVGSNGLTVTEEYIDSPIISSYVDPIVKVAEFSNIGITEDIDEAAAMQLLRDEVNKLYENGIDKPQISVKVDFIELSKVTEYQKYSNLESVSLGDTINFVIEPLNLDLTTRVVSVTYDCLLDRNVKLELGTITPNFVNEQVKTLNELKQTVASVNPTTILTQAQSNASLLLKHPFSGYTYFDESGNFYIMDTTSIETAQSIWKFGLGGIGYSPAGINGTFVVAMTQDGSIVADRITSGSLNTSIIEGLDNTLQEMRDDLGNKYTKEEMNTLLINNSTGITNIFKSSGGLNIFFNTSLSFLSPEGGFYYWNGPLKRILEENSSTKTAISLQNGTAYQEVSVKNGYYTLSFKYKKNISTSNSIVKFNDQIIPLTDGDVVYTTEITTGSAKIGLTCDTNDGYEMYDLMLNVGTEKVPYSQNQNEFITDTIKMSKGLSVEDNVTYQKVTVNADGLRGYNTEGSEKIIYKQTANGLYAIYIESDGSNVAQVITQRVGNQTWRTGL